MAVNFQKIFEQSAREGRRRRALEKIALRDAERGDANAANIAKAGACCRLLGRTGVARALLGYA